MNTLKLVGLLVIALALSVLLAFVLSPFLPFPFYRIFDRCFLGSALLAAYLFRVRMQKKPFFPLGLKREENSLSLLVNGVFFALFSLLVLTLITYLFGAVTFQYHPPKPKKIFYYVTSAVLIGFLEELLFRGLFLQTLMDEFTTWFSVAVSSLVYSLVHFIRPLFLNKPEEFSLFYTEVTGLFLFGVLMAYAFLKTRSLYLSIGLHGGFVFFLKMDGIFVNRLMVAGSLFGEERLIGGVITWTLFLVAFPWIWWLSRRNRLARLAG